MKTLRLYLYDSHSEIVRTENVITMPNAVVVKGGIVDSVFILQSSGVDDDGCLYGRFHRASTVFLTDEPLKPVNQKR